MSILHQHVCLYALFPYEARQAPQQWPGEGSLTGILDIVLGQPKGWSPRGSQGTSVVQTLVHCTFLETEVNMTSDT